MNQSTIAWPSRVGSWLVLVVGILLAVFVIGTWTDALSRIFALGLPAGPANQATPVDDASAGIVLVSAVISTIPLGAGLWGLWHVYKLLGERGLGRSISVGVRLRTIGLSLMLAALVIAGLSYGYAVMRGLSGGVQLSHIVIFAVGVVVLLIGVWRERRVE